MLPNQTPRIVSLLPSATEIVCALGLEDALVGVTHECDFPPSIKGKPQLTASRISAETMTSGEIDHAVRSQLDGHGSIYTLDEEQLHELKPDLILTQELCEVCAVGYTQVQQAAARMIEKDVRIVSLEPKTIKDIFSNIRMIAELLGKETSADKLVKALESRLDGIVIALSDLERLPRVIVLEWLEPPFKPGHWVPEQVALAGGDHTFGHPGKPSAETTAEAISAYAPEIIVLAPCGYYKEETLRALSSARLPEGWHDLPAVQKGEVWAVDAAAYFSRPGPRVVEGVEILSRIFHPEVYAPPDSRMAKRVPPELMKSA